MTPRPQIRLRRCNNDPSVPLSTSLTLTSCVTLFLFSDSSTTTVTTTTSINDLPSSPYVTTLRDTSIDYLLTPDFLTNHADPDMSITSRSPTSLVGYSLPSTSCSATFSPPQHHVSLTLLPGRLIVGVPRTKRTALGLVTARHKKHVRQNGDPPISIATVPFKSRADMARCRDRMKAMVFPVVHLSCGYVMMKPSLQDLGNANTFNVQCTPRVTDVCVNDALLAPRKLVHVLQHATQPAQVIDVLDRLQALASLRAVDPKQKDGDSDGDGEDVTTSITTNVKCIDYDIVCNAALADRCVQFARDHVNKLASQSAVAVVMCQAPPAQGVWNGDVQHPRVGDAGFTGDACEVVIVTKSHVFIAQLRPSCDAV